MDKKAVMFKTIQALVIMMVVIVIMITVERRFGEIADNEANKQICKTSVLAHAKSHLKGIDFSTSDINCPTKDVLIRGDDKDEIKGKIATEMYDCYDLFGAGSLELFDRDGVYCVICSRLDFEKDVEIRGFSKFLYTTRIPGAGNNLTYMDYLSRYETDRAAEVLKNLNHTTLEKLESESFRTDDTYSVIFLYAKGRDEVKLALDLTEKAVKSGTKFLVAGGAIAYAGTKIAAVGGGLSMSFVGLTIGAPLAAVGTAVTALGGTVVSIGAIWSMVESFATTDTVPEHVSMVLFRNYNESDIRELKCKYMPAKQNR